MTVGPGTGAVFGWRVCGCEVLACVEAHGGVRTCVFVLVLDKRVSHECAHAREIATYSKMNDESA
jgi:hypothetical protein